MAMEVDTVPASAAPVGPTEAEGPTAQRERAAAVLRDQLRYSSAEQPHKAVQ